MFRRNTNSQEKERLLENRIKDLKQEFEKEKEVAQTTLNSLNLEIARKSAYYDDLQTRVENQQTQFQKERRAINLYLQVQKEELEEMQEKGEEYLMELQDEVLRSKNEIQTLSTKQKQIDSDIKSSKVLLSNLEKHIKETKQNLQTLVADEIEMTTYLLHQETDGAKKLHQLNNLLEDKEARLEEVERKVQERGESNKDIFSNISERELAIARREQNAEILIGRLRKKWSMVYPNQNLDL